MLPQLLPVCLVVEQWCTVLHSMYNIPAVQNSSSWITKNENATVTIACRLTQYRESLPQGRLPSSDNWVPAACQKTPLITGIDHSHRKPNQTSRNTSAPKINAGDNQLVQSTVCALILCLPPCSAWSATIRGNLHIFPVPTTQPSIERRTPSEEEKCP